MVWVRLKYGKGGCVCCRRLSFLRTPSVFMPGSAEFSGVLIRKTRPEKVGFPVRLPPILVVHIGRDTVAAPADRYADAQRDVHHALLDGDELGRSLAVTMSVAR